MFFRLEFIEKGKLINYYRVKNPYNTPSYCMLGGVLAGEVALVVLVLRCAVGDARRVQQTHLSYDGEDRLSTLTEEGMKNLLLDLPRKRGRTGSTS